ncbi:MAG: D-alanyl-lipoteichoic acid biosynthesis protein DltB [Lachnospiraceae bacterium]
MNFFEGYDFYIFLMLALLPAIVLGLWKKPLRWYTLILSIFFIGVVFYKKPEQLFYLIVFYMIECMVVKGYLFLRNRYGRIEWLYYVAIGVGIMPLVLSKCAPLFHGNIFGFLGISYLTFKSVQMIIEIYDGIITEVPLLEYTGYVLFFPTLSSGPIDRSRRFHEDWNKVYERKEYLNLVGDGLFKLLLGLVYKIVFAAIFYQGVQYFEQSNTLVYLIGYAYAYGGYMFFDFAGYSLMAIGTSYILGVRTPDNFRKPFLAIDMKDFWDRWHITLSHWFRDFIFSRFIMKCVRKKWIKSRLTRAFVGFLVNMFLMGMWHGLNPSYLLYGIYHGVLLGCTEIYQKKSNFYRKYKDKKSYQIVSWFVTMQMVMFGFLIFSERFLMIFK